MSKANHHFYWSFYWRLNLAIGGFLIFFSTSLVAWPVGSESTEGRASCQQDERLQRNDEDHRARVDQAELSCESDGNSNAEEDEDYLLVPYPQKNLSAAWDVVEFFERKNPLDAYLVFAKENKKIISQIVIDGDGETSIYGEGIAETVGGKICQHISNNYIFWKENESFVNDYYKTLELNFSKEIADKVFPEVLRKEALDHGLSSSIVFNSLKNAHAEVLDELIRELDKLNEQPSQLDNQIAELDHQISLLHQELDQFNQEPSKISQQFPQFQQQFSEINRKFAELEEQMPIVGQQLSELNQQCVQQTLLLSKRLAYMLKTTPDAPLALWKQDDDANQSSLLSLKTHALEILDAAMTWNNCIIWLRRGIYLMGLIL